MAEELGQALHCARLPGRYGGDGSTSGNVLAIGLQRNARASQQVRLAVPGSCGCIHSEMNALVKARATCVTRSSS